MSFEIPTAFVEQYHSNVQLLSQQMGSRMQMCVRNETQNGESQFYEQIGATASQRKTSRHMDTPQIDTPHARRMCTIEDFVWADFIDREDKIRLLIDPTGPYARNAVAAFGRDKDDAIIEAGLGPAYTGKKGTVVVTLPAEQIVDAGGGDVLTIDKLIKARGLFWKNEVDEMIPLYAGVSGKQLEDLLATTEVTSSDYNTVKALVRGEVDTFMGFKFVRSERLPKEGDIRSCMFWAEDGILLATGQEITTDIGPRRDKNLLTQVHCAATIGGTRMEEVKVVQMDCNEAETPTP